MNNILKAMSNSNPILEAVLKTKFPYCHVIESDTIANLAIFVENLAEHLYHDFVETGRANVGHLRTFLLSMDVYLSVDDVMDLNYPLIVKLAVDSLI